MKRNLPNKVAADLAMELRKTITVGELRNIVNIYRNDYRIGVPRGKFGPMLCTVEMPDVNLHNALQTATTAPTVGPRQPQHSQHSRCIRPSHLVNSTQQLKAAKTMVGKAMVNVGSAGDGDTFVYAMCSSSAWGRVGTCQF